jgi:hypothetical protein
LRTEAAFEFFISDAAFFAILVQFWGWGNYSPTLSLKKYISKVVLRTL